MIKKIKSHLFDNGLEYYYIKKNFSLSITLEIWVNVGSSHENSSEYGICHMIEHMIFKGSEKIDLGILDTVFYMINGKTNAYTSKDFTVYTFTVLKKDFIFLLNFLFDLFDDPRFDEHDLITEKNVVLQEIQLYADDSYSKLFDESFNNSPSRYNYQHEILGNKKTVHNFSEKQLYDFYKKHYVLNNMKFFIIGDLSFLKMHNIMKESKFAHEKNNNKSEPFISIVYKNKIKKINYIYSETLNKHFLLTYLFPVCSYNKINLFKALNLILGAGKDSLLYQKLHIELQLVTDIRSFFHGFMKETYFFIYFNPINFSDLTLIITHIYFIIDNIVSAQYDIKKLEKIENILKFQRELLLSENCDDFITEYAPYAFEKKRNFLLYKDYSVVALKKKISDLAKNFKHQKSITNAMLPYQYSKKKHYNSFDLIFDNNFQIHDSNEIVDDISPNKKELVNLNILKQEKENNILKINPLLSSIKKNYLPKYIPSLNYFSVVFSNNLKLILIDDNQKNDIVVVVLSLKVKHYYDTDLYLGGISLLFDWLSEGTLNHPGNQFIEIIEKYGIEFSVNVGTIEMRCLKKYLSIALKLLSDIVKNPELSYDRFNLLKMQVVDNIKNFMDDSIAIGLQKMREIIYQDHPYGKNPSGTLESINKLTPDVVKNLFYKYISPDDAYLFIVGEVDKKEIQKIVELYFASWEYKKVENILFPIINNKVSKNINSLYIDKEQAVIIYGGLSVRKYSREFYYLLLADQLLSGSMNESMYAILFQIRDKSGMFYDISGSLVSGCGAEPGMIVIKAMTDKKNIQLAIDNIDNVINNFIFLFTKDDLLLAKKVLLLAMAEKNYCKSNIVNYFLNKYRYNLNDDDFFNYYNIVKKASLKDIKNALKLYFYRDKLELLIVSNKK